ncbi:MAG: TRAP transporter small permease subunit [Desulfarculaceae bacterium]|jgi:TRAP-type C4-dicarboxylate transport system permease small subunit
MAMVSGNRIKWLYKAEDAGRIVTIVAMTAIVFYQVAARILFKWSSPALEEAARFIMIWSIFIGAVVTTREDGHIKMGGFARTEKGKLLFELFSKVVTFAFLCVFVKWSFEFAVYSWNKGMNSIVLYVPLVVVHVCFTVTGTLMAFHTLVHLIDRIKKVQAYYKGGAR